MNRDRFVEVVGAGPADDAVGELDLGPGRAAVSAEYANNHSGRDNRDDIIPHHRAAADVQVVAIPNDGRWAWRQAAGSRWRCGAAGPNCQRGEGDVDGQITGMAADPGCAALPVNHHPPADAGSIAGQDNGIALVQLGDDAVLQAGAGADIQAGADNDADNLAGRGGRSRVGRWAWNRGWGGIGGRFGRTQNPIQADLGIAGTLIIFDPDRY